MTDYLTIAAVSDDLGVSRSSVERWIESGALAALKLPGGQVRIRRGDYDAFLQAAAKRARRRRSVPASTTAKGAA